MKPSLLSAVLLATLFTLVALHAAAAQEDGPDDKTKAFIQGMRAGTLDLPLDPLADIPRNWTLTPDALDAAFAVPAKHEVKKNPYFEWLTTTRDRAHFIRRPYSDLQVNLTLFDESVPVEEVTVDFLGDKLNGITVSVYNRGDADNITMDEFDRRMKICGQKLSAMLEVRPVARKANSTQGLLTEGWIWISAKGMAVLEYNPEATTGQPEFLRMRLAPRDAKGASAAAMSARSAAIKLSDLPRNVVRDPKSGDVYIKGIPMVDQGPKGYCVVAACQRLLEYYGIPCDQHQIAQIAGSDAERGTSTLAMSKSLEKIDYRFKTRFQVLFALMSDGKLYETRRKKPADFDDFKKQIVNYIDDGIPLLWSLQLGRFPEEPPISPQAGGGHMRLIIGYNSKDKKIIFSDTWGAGHEMKRMKSNEAYMATHGLFAMHPTIR